MSEISPIPMHLYCPRCHTQHIDEGEFVTRSHKTHTCQVCGEHFQPALVPTVGVKFLPGCESDAPIAQEQREEQQQSKCSCGLPLSTGSVAEDIGMCFDCYRKKQAQRIKELNKVVHAQGTFTSTVNKEQQEKIERLEGEIKLLKHEAHVSQMHEIALGNALGCGALRGVSMTEYAASIRRERDAQRAAVADAEKYRSLQERMKGEAGHPFGTINAWLDHILGKLRLLEDEKQRWQNLTSAYDSLMKRMMTEGGHEWASLGQWIDHLQNDIRELRRERNEAAGTIAHLRLELNLHTSKTFSVVERQGVADDLRTQMKDQVYRHYKGGLYRVLDVVVDEATGKHLVTYISLEHGYYWARTYENFVGQAFVGGCGDRVVRFTRVVDPLVVFKSRVPDALIEKFGLSTDRIEWALKAGALQAAIAFPAPGANVETLEHEYREWLKKNPEPKSQE